MLETISILYVIKKYCEKNNGPDPSKLKRPPRK